MVLNTDKKEESSSSADTKEAIMNTTKEFAEKLQALGKPAFEFFCALMPMMIDTGNKLHAIWITLDEDLIKCIIGFVFCFFGGMYPTVFAGVQAAEQSGRALVVKSIGELSEEATRILNESKKDDKESDGKENLSNKEYVKRKTLFVMQKMNPEKVNTAIRNIYTVWLAVISVLVIQFARTIQTAQSVADFLARPADKYVKPIVKVSLPPEYQQWVPIIMSWSCKIVGISLAWTLLSIRCAFASSLQGGLMLSRSGYEALRKRNIDLGGLIEGKHGTTNLDEYAAYGCAALGFGFQLYFRLSPPFPLNIILFPFQVFEWTLRYGVMKATSL